MTLKIERTFGARETQMRLSGQLRSEHIRQVRSEVEGAEEPVVLDLGEVDLVDVDGVRFLNECESTGISILRCSPYIKEWMLRERGEQANTK
jgi:anti-anti-sigma regulatory factor